jgi:DNA-binding LytR/AlgR family response regulator
VVFLLHNETESVNNQTLNVVIVDDDQACVDSLCQMLCAFPYVHVASTLNSSEGYMELLRSQPIDLVFLDIRIQEESGFTIAEFTKRNFPDKMIVFTTGFENFAIEGYEYEPLDFLAKPISMIRLERVLTHAQNKKRQIIPQLNAKIGIQLGSGLRFVEVDSILFLERIGRKIQMVCWADGQIQTHTLHESMRELENMLVTYDFLRVHQSFLVSARHIASISCAAVGNSYELELDHWKEKIPISRSKYKEIQQYMAQQGIPFL